MKLSFPILNDMNVSIESLNDIIYKRLMQESWLFEEAN